MKKMTLIELLSYLIFFGGVAVPVVVISDTTWKVIVQAKKS